jgi:HlyD family secretion protein
LSRARALIAVALLAVGAGAYLLGPRGVAPKPVGMVRTTEIRIAPEVSGRMLALRVKPGDTVRPGDVLATLDNPELGAAMAEARAAVAEARAEREHIYAGLRREQVGILDRDVQKARSGLLLAEQHHDRVAALAANQNASRQDLDKAAAEIGLAQSALAAARSRHEEAQAGPIAEERTIADAKVAAAEAAAVVIERRLAKTRLTAPREGIVRVIVAEPGEAIVTGRAVLTLEAAGERWFSFALREDDLAGIAIGTTLRLERADGRQLTARVSEISGLGAFATWRAARAVGDHDLNSFAVRADPEDDVTDLAPGMTVWLARP